LTDSPSDLELIARARLGDAGAFRLLVERHQDAVAAVVIGMLGRGDDADDVGQETFIRFHAALADFRGEASLRTYLSRIAMNLSLNALKQRKRHQLRFVSRDAASTPISEPAIEAIDLEADERRALVLRAIAQLGETQRPVVILRMLQELSTSETAAVLQLPPGTVMSRLSRGMAELERLLAPHITAES
jgi:RNA polymerase sigma-70 factor, ECF subfamily